MSMSLRYSSVPMRKLQGAVHWLIEASRHGRNHRHGDDRGCHWSEPEAPQPPACRGGRGLLLGADEHHIGGVLSHSPPPGGGIALRRRPHVRSGGLQGHGENVGDVVHQVERQLVAHRLGDVVEVSPVAGG